jgi:hypothetical protein
MAKPINITPVLKGLDAINFLKKIKAKSDKKVKSTIFLEIRKDAKALQSISK